MPNGVSVTYDNNGQTLVGTYTITESFSGDTHNYYPIADMTATLTITRATIVKPTADTTVFTYNGQEQTYVLQTSKLYTILNNTQINAGSYVVKVVLKDKANYQWNDQTTNDLTYSFVIAKATYNMSGVSFVGKTVLADKQNHALTITGTLPNGVTVAYSLTQCIDAGVYEITATFFGDYENYNAISDMKATLIIQQTTLDFESNLGEGHENDVQVSSPDGIDPNKSLVVEKNEISKDEKDYDAYLQKNQKAGIGYEIKLLDKNSAEVQPDGTLIIKILIPQELRSVEFGIMHIHAGDQTMIDYTIEGDFAVISTDQLSEFVFVYEVESLLWIIIVLAVIAILEVALFVVFMKKKQSKNTTKLAAAYPPFIFGVFVAMNQFITVIVLAVVVIALAVVDVILACKFLATKKTIKN